MGSPDTFSCFRRFFRVVAANSVEQRRQPVKQVFKDFAPVDFIKHFEASTGVEVVTDVGNTYSAIALYGAFQQLEQIPSNFCRDWPSPIVEAQKPRKDANEVS
jgi:hypothetical protein